MSTAIKATTGPTSGIASVQRTALRPSTATFQPKAARANEIRSKRPRSCASFADLKIEIVGFGAERRASRPFFTGSSIALASVGG
jgi:hypothetical protein